MKFELFVEYMGEKHNVKDVENSFKEMWKEKGCFVKDLGNVELYIKPEEKACYYVVADTGETGKLEL